MEKIKKLMKKKKKFRLLKNPKQTAESQNYFDQNHKIITVDIDGYYFSLDSEMDDTVDFLKKTYGFVDVE